MSNAEKFLEKLQKYERYITQIEDAIEIIKQAGLRKGFIGTRRITDVSLKIRAYYPPIEIFHVNGIALYDTEIVKYFLLKSFPNRHGFRKEAFKLMLESFSGIYAKPTKSESLILIDISSFYPSVIKQAFGIKYNRSYIGYSQEYQYHEPPVQSKPLRNSQYGLMRALNAVYFRHESEIKIKLVKMKNELLYPDLCLIIYDISQALCRIAVEEYGAVYGVVDGFIFKGEEPPEGFIRLIENLGFRWKIKAVGEGEVRCPYSWKVGEKRTLPFEYTKPNEYSNLYFSLSEAYEVIKKYETFLRLKEKALS